MGVKSLSLDEPLQGTQLLIAGLALAVGNFLVVLDTTIANVSIPNIAGGLAIAPTEGTWVITSYAVADAIVVPLTGWLATRYGPVKVMASAMMMFAFWSAVCGLSQNLSMLVIARVLQGASGAPMIPLSQSLLLRVFGRERAGAATGIWAMTTLVAPVLGPPLGGYLCDNYGWEWIFYVNVPVAVLCSMIILRQLASRDDKSVRVKVDVVGLLLLIVWVGALQVMLDKGRELDWFGSPYIVGLLVIAVMGFIAFVIWELTANDPIVNLRVFKNRTFALCCLVIATGYGAFFAGIVIIPLWMQTNLGYTATTSGYISSFTGITALIMAPIVARTVSKVDPRVYISTGLAIAAIVMFWRTGFTSTMAYSHIIFLFAVQGIGMPMFFLPLTSLALSGFEGARIANAAGLSSFVRTVSGAFAASLITTVWDNDASMFKADRVGSLHDVDTLQQSLMQAGQGADQARATIDNVVSSQSVMLATNHIFILLTGLLIFGAAITWLVPRPKKKLVAAAGH